MGSIVNRHILLVDDDLAIQDSLQWVLEGEGYTVTLANNGKEALDYLIKAELPALILLDIMMPVMDGFEFLEKQQQYPALAEIPVIILTADKYALSKIRYSKRNSFVCKPLDLNIFLNLIKDYVQH